MSAPTSEAPNGQSTQPGPFGCEYKKSPCSHFVANGFFASDSFLSSMDTPYEPAPAPPPGPALLDDNESNMLDNFFTTMNANHFTNDFWMRNQQNNNRSNNGAGAGAGTDNKSLGSFNFDWSNELPPTFEGSTTSLSQPTFPHPQQLSLDGTGEGLMQGNSNANSDILAAASMLYQNGMHGAESDPVFRQQRHLSNQGLPGLNGSGSGFNVQEKQLQLQPKQLSESPRARRPTGFHTSEMLFDTHKPVPTEQRSSKVRTLHWGSDISFMDQGYLAPPEQPNVEEQTKELLDNLQCLEPQSSAANTRAPSPDRTTVGLDASQTRPSGGPRSGYQDIIEEDSQPKKKQKTLIKEEDEESDEESPRLKSRRSRGSSSFRSRRGSNDTFRKSKAQQQSAKQAKENLTEEQKRSNHILSEQKRRNLIRQGFEELCSLVPGLRGGGFSKSAMLTQAADWLDDMIQGNDILNRQLAEMKNINGLVMPQ